MRRASLVVALVLALAAGAHAAAELLVFAAASLTDATKDVGRAWEQQGGERVTFNFGSSSDLARQIRAGAPADVFFAADTARMDELEQAGLVRRADRRDLLSNLLAVVVPAGSTPTLARPDDLAGVRRLALADPQTVPAGIYARTWLQSLGLWETLREKVVPALDVRAALAAVESEHVDAAIVYRTDAAVSKRVRVAFTVPREAGPRITYAMAPLGAAPHRDARALAAYLAGPEARAVYERYGFLVLPHD